MKVIIDGIEIEAENLTVKPDEENSEVSVISFEFEVIGENQYRLYKKSFQNGSETKPSKLVIPEKNLEIEAIKSSSTQVYEGDLTSNTPVRFIVAYKEVSEIEEEKWSIITGIGSTAVSNWARTRALSEILIARGLLTKEEYDETINKVLDRDEEEMFKFIKEGK